MCGESEPTFATGTRSSGPRSQIMRAVTQHVVAATRMNHHIWLVGPELGRTPRQLESCDGQLYIRVDHNPLNG